MHWKFWPHFGKPNRRRKILIQVSDKQVSLKHIKLLYLYIALPGLVIICVIWLWYKLYHFTLTLAGPVKMFITALFPTRALLKWSTHFSLNKTRTKICSLHPNLVKIAIWKLSKFVAWYFLPLSPIKVEYFAST